MRKITQKTREVSRKARVVNEDVETLVETGRLVLEGDKAQGYLKRLKSYIGHELKRDRDHNWSLDPSTIYFETLAKATPSKEFTIGLHGFPLAKKYLAKHHEKCQRKLEEIAKRDDLSIQILESPFRTKLNEVSRDPPFFESLRDYMNGNAGSKIFRDEEKNGGALLFDLRYLDPSLYEIGEPEIGINYPAEGLDLVRLFEYYQSMRDSQGRIVFGTEERKISLISGLRKTIERAREIFEGRHSTYDEGWKIDITKDVEEYVQRVGQIPETDPIGLYGRYVADKSYTFSPNSSEERKAKKQFMSILTKSARKEYKERDKATNDLTVKTNGARAISDDVPGQGNYYEILGVGEDVNPKDLGRRFRNLSKRWHPDHEGGSEEVFKRMNEAYETLSDPDKREAYHPQLS